MRKFSVFLLALSLIFFTSGMASALTLQSVDGEWGATVGGTDVTYIGGVAVPYGNQSQDQVRWGVPRTAFGQSGLGFTGVVPDPDLPGGSIEFEPEDFFNVGRLAFWIRTKSFCKS